MGSEANNNGGGGGSGGGVGGGSVEVSSWLKGLAVAPEYHPTLAEFQDPIAYIFKIEKEASRYGICKIVPPVSQSSKKSVLTNLNRSLSARSGGAPTFTTRQQQIGFCPRKHNRPVQKPVWQSGECYTVQEFEAKAKGFEKAYLKKFGKKPLSALEMETLFWKATLDKPFSVEYANDMPGSAFSVKKDRGGEGKKNNSAVNNCNVVVGETEWNMRGVSRAKGSLLRFMKEEIPGVTSPMVYIAMMFSWFAWHVEDHDLHSLNYHHMGAGKTWYGVPRDAAVAFEDVIRAHGYGGEINPLVTFATLGEKTTVMSPEVLISAGVPCCRLVQNPGEFVVTFPRAYHSGFSHGFNCGEAANIATPEWLLVAEDAAIRRASINCPPMVSHFQLLYDLALSLCSRVPKKISLEPRSSRLKDKNKDEGEILVKDIFVQNVLQNNNLLHILGKGSSVVILPRISLSKSICSNLQGSFQSKMKARLFTSLSSPDLKVKTRKSLVSEDVVLDRNQGFKQVTGPRVGTQNDGDQFDRVTSQGLFSCVTCGILCFASVAIVQPSETAAKYLMSGDCSIFGNWDGKADCLSSLSKDAAFLGSNSSKGLLLKRARDGLFDEPTESSDLVQPFGGDHAVVTLNTEAHKGTSSLGLLALNYGNCSDSEDDANEADIPVVACETKSRSSSLESGYDCDNMGSSHHSASNCRDPPCPQDNADHGHSKAEFEGKTDGTFDYSRHKSGLINLQPSCSLDVHSKDTTISEAVGVGASESIKDLFAPRSDEDSSRMHVFCLQHAVKVERQLRLIGGANVVLLCHPDYPDIEAQAKKVAEELGNVHLWSNNSFREASKEDEEMIQLVLDSEEAIHGNGDWAVKLGINLYYSANLSRSPLYSKQIPYNHIIYNAFGCSSMTNSQANIKWLSGRHRKVVVAGKWCGKVWMSNQVHPLLSGRESGEHGHERNMPCPVKPDIKLQRPSETTKTAETASTTCKTGRKRKTLVEGRSVIKAETLESEDPDNNSELVSVSGRQHRSNPRNKRMKKDNPEPLVKSVRHGKQPEAQDSEEDSEVPLISSSKQKKNNLRHKQMKKETPELRMGSGGRHRKQVEAEESEDDFENLLVSSKLLKNSLINKRMKKEKQANEKQREDREDDFADLLISCKLLHKNLKNKRMKKESPEPQIRNEGKSKHLDSHDKNDETEGGPSTRLRKRTVKPSREPTKSVEVKPDTKKQNSSSRAKKAPDVKVPSRSKITKMKQKQKQKQQQDEEYHCEMEGCAMSFVSKQELMLHKKNMCPVKGCGKKFFSHKYLVQHRRVHLDDRPLKCPWKGCKMTFKWAWARTEHIRVHTGARPYVCAEAGCGQTFRFVSDFSRHKRKTGHIARKMRR